MARLTRRPRGAEPPSGPAVVFGPPVSAGGKTFVPVSEEHGFMAKPLGLLEMGEQGAEYYPVSGEPPILVAALVALAGVLLFMAGRWVFDAVRG